MPATSSTKRISSTSPLFEVSQRNDHGGCAKPGLKVGLTNNIDFEVNIAPFVHIDSTDRSTGLSNRESGPSDLFLRSKINLWVTNSALALIPYVKALPLLVGSATTPPREE
jgi:hypothetical protein